MGKKRLVNKALDKYGDGSVKTVGRFIYNIKMCKILNCDTLQEFMIEKNDVFIERLKSNQIPNVKVNRNLRYIHKEITLYGHIEKLQHSNFLIYETDSLA